MTSWKDFPSTHVSFPSTPDVIPNRGDCMLLDMLYNPRHVPVVQERIPAWFEPDKTGWFPWPSTD